MKIAIVTFPGTSGDQDCERIIETTLGGQVERVWHGDRTLPAVDGVILPGGSSYGDYLRAGAIGARSPVMDSIAHFARQGGSVLGIGNGFQILLERHLLPGAMQRNRFRRFLSLNVFVRCQTTQTFLTSMLNQGSVLRLPIACAWGCYFIDEEGLKSLHDNSQIVFQYTSANGEVSDGVNPCGSVSNIAGICSIDRNVVGLMPHPERATEELLGNVDGLVLFRSMLRGRS